MSSVEDIGHILAGCPQISSRFYLPLRHDEVEKTFLYSRIKKYNPIKKITLSNESEYIYIYICIYIYIYVYTQKNLENIGQMYQ